jgi:hypothetical protein
MINMDSERMTETETQKDRLNVLRERIEWCFNRLVIVILILGATMIFAFPDSPAFKLAFILIFVFGVDMAAIMALIIAFQELKRNKNCSIGIIVFWVHSESAISLHPYSPCCTYLARPQKLARLIC